MDAPPVKTCRSVLFRTALVRIVTHSPRDSCVSSERIGITIKPQQYDRNKQKHSETTETVIQNH